MPRIQRQVARIGAVAPQPTAEQFGAAEGRALTQLGQSLGALAETGERVFDGFQQQLVRNKAVEAEDQLRRFAEEQAANPDFEARERAFLEKADEIRNTLSSGLTPRRQGDFLNVFKQAQNRHAVTVRAQARQAEFSAAQALANETLRKQTIKAANSGPFDQIVAQLEGEGTILDLAQDFGIPDAVARQQIQDFRQSVSDARLTQLLRTDPVRAFMSLAVPDQGLAAGRTEQERQVLLTRSANEVQSNAIREMQLQQRASQQEERQRKAAARGIQLSFLAQAQTPEGLSVAEIEDLSADILDPETKRGWIQWALDTGGQLRPKQTNTIVFQQLRDASKRGDDVTADVYEAVRDGALTMSDGNALLSTSEDVRFGPADEFIDSLRVGELARVPGVAQRAARAQFFFEEWKREHPNATLAEAFEAAEREVERADVFGSLAGNLTIARTPPRFAPRMENGTFDLEAGELETMRRFMEGEISEAEKDRELDLIEDMRTAQEAQEKRRRLRESGGER